MDLSENKCVSCEAEKATPEFERSQACKDAADLPDSIEKCEAWIKREYPSACVAYQGKPKLWNILSEVEELLAKLFTTPHNYAFSYSCFVYDVGSFGFIHEAASNPLLALQSVIGQIIKRRGR